MLSDSATCIGREIRHDGYGYTYLITEQPDELFERSITP